MELQSIVAMGRVMEFFRARVETSQKNLGVVEEVLREWLSVTKAWASLEAIFLGSADIRSQVRRQQQARSRYYCSWRSAVPRQRIRRRSGAHPLGASTLPGPAPAAA